MSELTDNDIERVIARMQSACTDTNTLIEQMRDVLSQTEMQRDEAERARQQAEDDKETLRNALENEREAHVEAERDREQAEADAARLRGIIDKASYILEHGDGHTSSRFWQALDLLNQGKKQPEPPGREHNL